MKILVDTSVMIGNMRYYDRDQNLVWKILNEKHTLVLTDFILEELKRNLIQKYSKSEIESALQNLTGFLGTGLLEMKTTNDYRHHLQRAEELISRKDSPILAAAMLDDIDYLITRDQDFLSNQALEEKKIGRKIKNISEFLRILTKPEFNS